LRAARRGTDRHQIIGYEAHCAVLDLKMHYFLRPSRVGFSSMSMASKRHRPATSDRRSWLSRLSVPPERYCGSEVAEASLLSPYLRRHRGSIPIIYPRYAAWRRRVCLRLRLRLQDCNNTQETVGEPPESVWAVGTGEVSTSAAGSSKSVGFAVAK
jgi:hypothetical protein